jgi:type I restriction enzyme S subunit
MRIAAILDKADSIRAKRREALAQADALLRATFVELFGDLVANPKDWDTLPIADIVADGPQNGLYRHSSEYGSGTPILRIDSFYDGRTKDLSALKRVRIDEETIARWALRPDDMVINRVNSLEYLGKSAIIPLLAEPTVFESNMMRFAVNRSVIEPGFLIDQLQTAYVQRQIRQRARPAVNQSSINQDDVKSFEVRVPPVRVQQKYIAAAKRIERFGEVARAALFDADALYASLAQRAFRGEL